MSMCGRYLAIFRRLCKARHRKRKSLRDGKRIAHNRTFETGHKSRGRVIVLNGRGLGGTARTHNLLLSMESIMPIFEMSIWEIVGRLVGIAAALFAMLMLIALLFKVWRS